jgi:pimeloyl-ACP methyl ester carboxylesterase
MRGRLSLCMAGLCIVAFGGQPAGAMAKRSGLRLAGGETRVVKLCGATRHAMMVSAGERVVVRRAPRGRLTIDRCARGRWIEPRRVPRGSPLPTEEHGDFRIRSARTNAYLRVGVGELVDVAVRFAVRNTNTSRLPCPTDGADYEVVGDLVAPVAALDESTRNGVTVLLHGVDAVGYLHLRAFPQYDLATNLAKRGHVVVALDRLGYGRSGKPPGGESCIGGQADVAQQILARLRSGDYLADARAGPSFARTGLAGHSGGGGIAQPTAYSYPAMVDALVVMAFADQGFTTAFFTDVARGDSFRCAGDRDYHYVFTESDWARDPLAGVDPAVLESAKSGRARNPCGDLGTIPVLPAIDRMYLHEIAKPVLLAFGTRDALVDASGQREHYTGTTDVTEMAIEGGHSWFLEASAAPVFQAQLSEWLRRRGL